MSVSKFEIVVYFMDDFEEVGKKIWKFVFIGG